MIRADIKFCLPLILIFAISVSSATASSPELIKVLTSTNEVVSAATNEVAHVQSPTVQTRTIKPIQGSKCLPHSIRKIYDMLINYNNYYTLDDASSDGQIDLFESRAKFLLNTPTQTQARLWVNFQPTNLIDRKLYPHCVLQVSTQWAENEESFVMKASILKLNTTIGGLPDRFALERFDLVVNARMGCPADRAEGIKDPKSAVWVDYDLKVETNVADVEAIKSAVGRAYASNLPISESLAKDVIDKFFDQDRFFGDYFDRLFQNLLETLNR